MANHYLTMLLLAAGSAAAQTTPATTPPLAEAPLLADTLRPAFRGRFPDSLAATPTPGGTVRLQGREQPARPFLTIQDQLRTVAGVQVTPYDGSPGSGNVVRIRGASVAQGLAQPLYVVDGLPALNDDLTPGQALGVLPTSINNSYNQTYQATVAEQNAEVGASPLQLLPPEAIESIEVLAGPAAVARYGPLGANGVISIRTRRGRADRALRVRYSAYAGVQQVRQRYDLLEASDYAKVANEAVQRAYRGTAPPPYASTALGAGTDWQAETYRLAGLHQHQVSLDGGRAGTSYLLSADFRQQSGVLRGSDLTRLGLRLALGQQLGRHLTLHGTATLGQTDQRLPNTLTAAGATRAALLAPPTQPVRNAQGAYSGYGSFNSGAAPVTNFTNPLAVADYAYRTPQTRRVLSQLAATYTPVANLTVEAAANFQRTLFEADNQAPVLTSVNAQPQAPTSSYSAATQRYRTSQWAARLAVRYQRHLGQRHEVSAEVDYQYQAANIFARTEFQSYPPVAGVFGGGGYYEQTAEFRLHRPWAAAHYTFDSTLTVQAGLSYGHYRDANRTEYYPNAQLGWQAHPGQLAMGLWLGAARSSALATGYGLFGPAPLPNQSPTPGYFSEPRYQSPLYVDQVEAGLRLGRRGGLLTGQLVAYQRISHHALLMQTFVIPQSTGYVFVTSYDEATIRNQGLELTLAANWRRGRLQGTTALVGSLNRNRLREADSPYPLSPAFANQPVGTFYGYQQDGLNPDGSRRFVQTTSGGVSYSAQDVIGSGIPAQLASLSQQLRLGRLALDAQVDGLFGYQVLNQQLALLDTPTGFSNSATSVNDRWTPTHQNTTIPAAGSQTYDPSVTTSSTNINFNTDRLLENGANVRLSSLTLTYRLRQTATQDFSVWVGGQNLFVLTGYRGYDPNVSSGGATSYAAGQDYGAVPVPRTWLLGVKAEF